MGESWEELLLSFQGHSEGAKVELELELSSCVSRNLLLGELFTATDLT